MRWSGWLVFAVACSGGTEDGDNNDSPVDSFVEDTAPEVVEDRSASLSVRVVDEAENPVVAADVRFCRGPVCLFAESDAEGRFGFDDVVVDWHSLEVIPPEGSSGLATVFAPIDFQTNESRGIDLTMPPLDPATALPTTAAPLQVGAGLQIALAAGDLEPPTFVDEATEVAGVRLTDDQYVPLDDVQGTVVAMWFLDPFDHEPTVDVPMTFTNDYNLAELTELRVIVGDYTTSQWLEAGTLIVKSGALQGDVKLPVTSTVVLLDVTN